jgi:hypothetical protein
MQRDPHVDRRLGELWLISDVLTADINGDFASKKAEVARWEPAPMPHNWHPSQGRRQT